MYIFYGIVLVQVTHAMIVLPFFPIPFSILLGLGFIFMLLGGILKLTQEVIDQIQEAMNHTKKNGDLNWNDGDEIEVQLAGTLLLISL